MLLIYFTHLLEMMLQIKSCFVKLQEKNVNKQLQFYSNLKTIKYGFRFQKQRYIKKC